MRQLRSLLPICAYCHRIRGEGDRWESMERVLEQRTGSELSHGICPDCVGQQAGDRDPFKAGGANERPGCGKGSGARAGADID